MAPRDVLLTDAQWETVKKHLPTLTSRGRPFADDRACLEGILWVLRTGARWQDLPDEYPSPSTCWRRLKLWSERGVWLTVWRALLGRLDRAQRLDWEEAFADGTFCPAKKGGPASVKPSGARARSLWWWQTVRAFRWESPSTRPAPRRSRSSKKR